MPDVLTPAQRSRCMAAIRSKDTKPEIAVRRVAFRLGYRYRLHVRSLPGTPDLVFPRLRKVINVSGCFWHLHGCGRCHVPAARRAYWLPKLRRNQQRDRATRRALNRRGWRVLTIWECQTKDAPRLAERIARFLAEWAANNRGRNASLDEKKERAAGRGMAQGYEPDFDDPPGRKRTLGAFGNPGPTRAKSSSGKRRKGGGSGKGKPK